VLIKRGRLLDSSTYRRILALVGGSDGAEDIESSMSPSLEDMLSTLPTARAQDYDVAVLERQLDADLTIFNGLIDRLDRIRYRSEHGSAHDDKLEQIKNAFANQPLIGKKVLIFSYYEDTARYLYEKLRGDQQWSATAGSPRLALLTGRTPPTERKVLIEAFAPRSNLSSRDVEEIDVLISTDVLSEGQNLQDAAALVNYDLHWNPVRMIQRAGRIDRVGSMHAELLIYNCFPEDEFEQLLGLVGRLQRRIEAIAHNLGNDASILGEVVNEKSLDDLRRLRMRDQSVLDELASHEEAVFSGDDMRLPLLAHLQQIGEQAIGEIPMGIHSGRGGQSVNGIFFAFRSRDHHFWRFYEIENGVLSKAPITDRRRLFQMIACLPQEPRVVEPTEIWPYLEQATKGILSDIRRHQGTERVRAPMTGLNLRLHHALASRGNAHMAEHELPEQQRLMERLMSMLQNTPLRPFERDPVLRQIQQVFGATGDLNLLISELDAFAIEHDLYMDVPSARPSTFAGISAEDLQLVCYELFYR